MNCFHRFDASNRVFDVQGKIRNKVQRYCLDQSDYMHINQYSRINKRTQAT